jgi:hypothetical protein
MATNFNGKHPAGAQWGSRPKTERSSPLPPMKLPPAGISFSLPPVRQAVKPRPQLPHFLPLSTSQSRAQLGVNFLEILPQELRDQIYREIVDDEQPAGNIGKRNSSSERDHLCLKKWGALLLVSQQAHNEFAPILYQASHFTFNLGLGSKIHIYTFLQQGYLWEISECLKHNLRDCSLKVELSWSRNNVEKM